MKRHARNTITGVAAAAVLLLSLAGCTGISNGSPEEAAKGYLEAVAAKDVDKAISYTEEGSRRAPDEVVFSSVSDPEIGESSIEGDTAWVDSTYVKSGKPVSGGLNLVKVDGGWYILGSSLIDGF